MLIKKILKPENEVAMNLLFETVAKNTIANVNWKEEYPYAPKVEFSIVHDGDNVYIRYYVNEQYTAARYSEDFGEVWTDSCVEFFVAFDSAGYYNYEFNCIGTALMAFRKDRQNSFPAARDIMMKVKRYPSYEHKVFEEIQGDNSWTLTVVIPKECFFAHKFETLSGIKATANFYKCGDNLSKPHFLSWNKIDLPSPDFHVPKFFGDIKFE